VWIGVAGLFLLIVGTLLALLFAAECGSLSSSGGWAREAALPPRTVSTCVSQLAAGDKLVRAHGRDVLIHVAQECPAVADLLARPVAALLQDSDMMVRAQTIEGLATLGSAARPYVAQITASRGSGVVHLDHIAETAVARIQNAPPVASDGNAYCSLLSRSAVETAIRTPVRLSWSRQEAYDSDCTTGMRGGL
jgi:hypothetical protein